LFAGIHAKASGMRAGPNLSSYPFAAKQISKCGKLKPDKPQSRGRWMQLAFETLTSPLKKKLKRTDRNGCCH
jgi:hypothetical protein